MLETRRLDQLVKILKENRSKVVVGILGGSNTRRGHDNVSGGLKVNAARKQRPKSMNFNSNAAVGAAHEFGGVNTPQRSFLRVPISRELDKQISGKKLYGEDQLRQMFQEGSIKPWLSRLGILAESIVIQAFETRGFGLWKPWKDPNYGRRSHNKRVLDDTGQLKESITSEVRG